MKKRGFVRTLTATALTAALVMSMGGMTAFAAPTTFTIKKSLEKDANAYTPGASYSFTITPVDGYTNGTKVVSRGEENGITSTATIVTPADKVNKGIGDTTVEIGGAELTVDVTKFSHAGIYRYQITEDEVTYEGVTKDESTKYIEVYIVNADGGLALDGVALTDVDGNVDDSAKSNGVFVNKYKSGEDGNLANLTIQKNVTGNQGDKTKAFEFTVTVTDADVEGEQYYVVFSDSTQQPITIVSGEGTTISLTDGQTATIYGLSESDEYTVTEKDYSELGYTTTVDGDATNTKNGSISTDTTLVFVNNKSNVTPTGIAMTFAPYVLLVGAAGVFAVMFLRKKREDF